MTSPSPPNQAQLGREINSNSLGATWPWARSLWSTVSQAIYVDTATTRVITARRTSSTVGQR